MLGRVLWVLGLPFVREFKRGRGKAKDSLHYQVGKSLTSSIFIRFNFPAMIPLWTLPIALSSGNTLILKPSERVPGASAILAELATQAGVPPGVLNIVHGGKDTVNAICDDRRIKGITFVGSDVAGKHIWDRAGKRGARVQVSATCWTKGLFF